MSMSLLAYTRSVETRRICGWCIEMASAQIKPAKCSCHLALFSLSNQCVFQLWFFVVFCFCFSSCHSFRFSFSSWFRVCSCHIITRTRCVCFFYFFIRFDVCDWRQCWRRRFLLPKIGCFVQSKQTKANSFPWSVGARACVCVCLCVHNKQFTISHIHVSIISSVYISIPAISSHLLFSIFN